MLDNHNKNHPHTLFIGRQPTRFGAQRFTNEGKGWPFSIRTTPMPSSLAFVSIIKGEEKSSRANTGAEAKACFKV